jgi:hypothetical protein
MDKCVQMVGCGKEYREESIGLNRLQILCVLLTRSFGQEIPNAEYLLKTSFLVEYYDIQCSDSDHGRVAFLGDGGTKNQICQERWKEKLACVCTVSPEKAVHQVVP